MNERIALIGGQGWPVTETPAGLPTLAARLTFAHVQVQIFSHVSRPQIKDYLDRFVGFRALIGDSLGAGVAAIYAEDQAGTIDFVGGFQPSAWDPVGQGPLNDRTITVAKNVLVAHCIWDPMFIDTGGLGNAHYVLADPRTKLTTTEHRGLHPDDWAYSQNLMFAHVMTCIRGI